MKCGIFITVRTGSSRLPQKALMKVKGKPIISYLINRIKQVNRGITPIFVCTTDLEEDLVLCDIAAIYGVQCYRGNRNNIIRRHFDCAVSNGIEFIVNVDGDDILCNPEYIMKIVDIAKNGTAYEIIKSVNLPFGTNSIGYKRSVIERILSEYSDKVIDTGWGQLLNDKTLFNTLELQPQAHEVLEARMTLDYQEDFEFFKNVIENVLDCENFESKAYVQQKNILDYLRNNADIVNINSHLNEIYWENYNKSKIAKKEGIVHVNK